MVGRNPDTASDWGFSVAIKLLSRKVLGTGRSHKPDRVAFDSLFRNQHGPSIRSDDCIRIAGVFLFPPRRTLMDLRGQSCCTLFPFFDILEALGVRAAAN